MCCGSRPLDARSNLYSLGCIFYYLLAGRALEELGQSDDAMVQLAKVPPRATQYVAAQSLIGRLLRDRLAGRARTRKLARESTLRQAQGDVEAALGWAARHRNVTLSLSKREAAEGRSFPDGK